MLLELFIFMEFLVFTLFLISFFTRQELLWFITAVFSGIMMMNSFNIEVAGYVFNSITGNFDIATAAFSYPYLMGINLLVFSLCILMGTFDAWDKFGQTKAGI